MDNIEILDSNVPELDLDLDSFDFHEPTLSESLKEFEKSRSNPFLKTVLSGAVISGAMLIGANSVDASGMNFLRQNIIEQSIDIEQFLNTYKSDIEQTTNQNDLFFHNGKVTKHDVVKKILSFKALCNNWDGHGAYPLEIECASNALLFVDLLGEKNIWNVKEVYPNPNGTITFEWNNELDEVLNLEIGKETISYFVEIAGMETVYADQKFISSNEAKRIIEYISVL